MTKARMRMGVITWRRRIVGLATAAARRLSAKFEMGTAKPKVGGDKDAVGEAEEGEVPAMQPFEQTLRLPPQLCMH